MSNNKNNNITALANFVVCAQTFETKIKIMERAVLHVGKMFIEIFMLRNISTMANTNCIKKIHKCFLRRLAQKDIQKCMVQQEKVMKVLKGISWEIEKEKCKQKKGRDRTV